MLLLQVSQSIATAACCLQEHEDEFGMTLCARGQALEVGETMSSVGAANQPQHRVALRTCYGAMQQAWSELKIVATSRHLSVAGVLVGSVYRDISKQEPHSLGLSFPNSPQDKHQREAVDEGLTTGSTQTSALADRTAHIV